jgi:hypothetical protein
VALWRIAQLGDKPRHTWNEAVVRWLKEQSHKARRRGTAKPAGWTSRAAGAHDINAR